MPKQGFLNLRDKDYWGTQPELIDSIEQLIDRDFEGLVLDGPKDPVDITKHDTLPLFAICVSPHARNALWSFEWDTLIVACDKDRLRNFVGMAATPSRGVPEQEDSELIAHEDYPEGSFGSQAYVEARERANLPWEQGNLQLVLVWGDWVSNPVQLQLVDPQASKSDPDQLDSIDGDGISLTTNQANAAPADLNLSFRIRARHTLLSQVQGIESGDPKIPITFIAKSSKQKARVEEVFAEGTWSDDPETNRNVSGDYKTRFDVLFPDATPGDYYVYAFLGGHIGGPIKISID